MGRTALIIFAVVGILLGIDVIDDIAHGADWGHVGVELLAFGLCAVTLVYALLDWAQSSKMQLSYVNTQLASVAQERDRWRDQARESLRSLSQIIDEQFLRWQLTEAEKEVGLLILKGLSHKEIADVRGSSERTVRQQATALYKKAGLSGKANLSAYFLEDVMLPSKPHGL